MTSLMQSLSLPPVSHNIFIEMYFTRNVYKKIKLNHDIEDMESSWVSPYSGNLYHRWLYLMRTRYSSFDIRSHHIWQQLVHKWHVDAMHMYDTHTFDSKTLQDLHPEVYKFDTWLQGAHARIEKKSDLKKLTWVYSNIKENPHAIIGILESD